MATFAVAAPRAKWRRESQTGMQDGPLEDAAFEAAFRHASIGMALVSPEEAFIRVNPAFCRITGYAEAELLTRDAAGITHPDDQAESRALMERIIRGECETYDVEKRYLRPDGGVAWVLLSVSAIRNLDGSIRHFLGQAQDIGARRTAEAALRASEARYRTIAETTSDIIVLTNLRGFVEYVSPAVRLVGWRPEDLIGKRFVDRLHPEDIPVVKSGVGRLLETGSVDRLRWRARHGDTGEWRWFESNANLMRDDDGKVTTILDVVRDVHNQVVAAAEIAAARAAAEQAAQAKSQFLANITHEIRTPLTAVLGFTDLLRRRGDLPAEAADQIERIEWAGRGLLALVNDVLDFSKLEAGRFEIRATPTNLRALGEEVAAIFHQTAQAKGLDLALVLDPRLDDAVLLDPDRLRQMLLNLVGNALKFTTEGRVAVTIGQDARDGWIRIEVSDTGPGIPLNAQAELFQRFSQVDGTRARGHGGAGLGLAITRGIAEAMGGEVALESASGAGATFILRLPAPVVEAEAADSAPEAPGLSGLRVLVVDDNAANRVLAEQMLSILGVRATTADGGEAGLRLLAEARFDVVLMDLRMPGIDGVETLQRLRATTGPNRETPVLAFTADPEAEAAACEDFAGVVGKPIDPVALALALSRYVPA